MDVLDMLNNILPIIFFIFIGVFFFIIGLCINKRTKVIIRGTPSVVPSSSVLVNVYGGGQPAAAEEAGGGAANGGGGDSGGGSKVVSDGSKVGAKVVTISIDGITGKVNTTTNNGSADQCGICKKPILLEPASVNGGVRANGGSGAAKGDGCEDGSKVVRDGSKVGGKVTTIVIDSTSGKIHTTTTTTHYLSNNGSADKCGICKKAILLEPASVDGGVRDNGDGGGSDDGVGSGATGGVGGGGSHATK